MPTEQETITDDTSATDLPEQQVAAPAADPVDAPVNTPEPIVEPEPTSEPEVAPEPVIVPPEEDHSHDDTNMTAGCPDCFRIGEGEVCGTCNVMRPRA